MARIVCIDTGTVTVKAEIGDIVTIHDDDVDLSGSGYANFKIYDFPGVTASDLREKVVVARPEVKTAWKSTDIKWTLDHPSEKEVWKDSSGDWCDLVESPKFVATLKNMTSVAETTLKDKVTDKATKLTVFSAAITEKIALNSKNLVKVDDLNKAVIVG